MSMHFQMNFPHHRTLCLCGKNSSGFTLLEILIAMFIFAIVLSTIYTSYTGTFRIVDETQYQADIYGMARITLERMHEDLESVYITQYSEPSESNEEGGGVVEFLGEDKEIKDSGADSLRFISRAHLVFGEEEQAFGKAEIGYYVGENDEGEGLVLYRTDTPVVAQTPGEGTGGSALCEKLLSINFTYHDANGEVYDNWDSAAKMLKEKIPQMVSILLEFVNRSDPETPFKFMTRVALPMGREQE